MPAPVNVRLMDPTKHVANWPAESVRWACLNRDIGGNPDFFPLTVKGAYVIGIIHEICESVTCLIKCQTAPKAPHIPAYGVVASGIELLGRCITGNSRTNNAGNDLKTGLKWLASSSYRDVPADHVLVSTQICQYSVNDLAALRHFAAHGQATVRELDTNNLYLSGVDRWLLGKLRPQLANGLDRYWTQLVNDENLCNNLASASVIALRNWPVFKIWSLFEKNDDGEYESISAVFNKFDWSIGSV